MEEGEYKSTYNELVSVRCVFEKALLSHQVKHQVKCCISKHFCLADREAYACQGLNHAAICAEFLEKLREKSTFALKLREISGPLPHNMEIRVQVGGITGLAKGLDVETDDVSGILNQAQEEYGGLEKLPYDKIIQSVVQFQGRRRRS